MYNSSVSHSKPAVSVFCKRIGIGDRILRTECKRFASLGVPYRRNSVGSVKGGFHAQFKLLVCGRRKYSDPGNSKQHRNVENALMSLAVLTRKSRTVDTNNNMNPVYGCVMNNLIVGTLQKAGIHRKKRKSAALCKTCRKGNGVLFGYPNVEKSFGVLGSKIL